jgi:SAM-dependent methyltransferase
MPPPGSRHYRAYVGYADRYDLIAAMQFNLITALGLRDWHRVLDIGCGSLRLGRLLIPFLRPERYFGIEPEQWLVEEGIRNETGQDLLSLKQARISYRDDFQLTTFETTFDFMMAQSIFSHATQRQIEVCLEQVATCLAPDGLLIASFVVGPDDYTGDSWVYPQCVTYTEAAMHRMAEQAGLRCKVIEWPHPNAQTWALFYRPTRLEPDDPTFAMTVPRGMYISDGSEPAAVGFIDGMWDVGPSLLIYGWAADTRGAAPVSVMFVDAGSRIIGAARVDIERPDVAAAHGETLRRSGFQCRIVKTIAQAAGEVTCHANFSSGAVLRLATNIRLTMHENP